MPIMLNFSNGRILPESEVEALRNVARSNQSDVLLVGSRSLRLHHISFMDGFSVEPIPGSFLDRIGERRHRRLAESLERQLNGGSSFLQAFSQYIEQTSSAPPLQESVRNEVQSRVNSYAFSVNPGDFPCSVLHLSCPITLCVPETGVFVKNARCSKVCSLYDISALTEMLRRNASHPLSREAFTPGMIVHKEECNFNTTEQHFCILPRSDTRL
ncbi:T3SS effector NleG family protein [Citrobacter rodentium]|uniref:E3 ubiquitin-protein ligase NleG8 n=2 Tax=Citrobacter rodentium TaxID=67825 RepID=NLEG8_CITRO|nr:T3SS effector NleG family protein [Citrobacter rodentium]QBY30403.1 DUF1076 domain-containing protein [Citrobacter rodentium]UHO32226.1 DUF1076 domain-containing protein [Citrobacter rodentium NBRC 105723 = DSM 16636]CBG90798.1 putative T3SS effector protein NleG8 [Citrobacter rodentium ICC168]HAT8012597.1 T3SS effector protein NleG8 [Citrobacter rodentium NBRC 105723 = DSM 16636]HAT8017897.1 T3SS effector protein NleG8 [Citrobacter rodentium]